MSDSPQLVLCQRWEDYFPAFGSRLVGFSYHLGPQELADFTHHRIRERNRSGVLALRPAGEPYWARVSAAAFLDLLQSGGSSYYEISRRSRPPLAA